MAANLRKQSKKVAPTAGGDIDQAQNMAMNPEIWRYIFDAIEEPTFLHDAQYRLILVNRAYCRIVGLTEAQVLGKPYWEVFPPGSGPLPGCQTAADGTDETDSQDDVSVGAKRLLSKGYTVRDAQDKYLCSLHALSDITERKQAEANLAEQLEELRRWHETTMGREGRVLELKHEVNQLLAQAGQPLRYPSAETPNPKEA